MKDFISNNILLATANAIRACENSNNTIAPKDFADRIRALDKLIPQPDALNFYMPNGGTIALNKYGTPTEVELEYSIDRGNTWTVWQPDNDGNRSLTITKEQKVFIRNTSETSTGFSTSSTNYYKFAFDSTTYAGGNTSSLLCKNPANAVITNNCLRVLFSGETTLITAPNLPALVLKSYCYSQMFMGCTNLILPPIIGAITQAEAACWKMFSKCLSLEESPELKTEVLAIQCYQEMFHNCSALKKVRVRFTEYGNYSLLEWISGVSPTGDFYCPSTLTIPTGSSGIPNGWTRHDI